jgi:formate dehydrogenase subunit delta
MAGLPPNVRLANEIAEQFTRVPADRAAAEIAAHMRSFWEKRMIADLLTRVDAGTADLDPLATAAVELLRT